MLGDRMDSSRTRSLSHFISAMIMSLLLLGWMGSALASAMHSSGMLPPAQATNATIGQHNHDIAHGSTINVPSYRFQTCNNETCALLGCCVLAKSNDPDTQASLISSKPLSVFATATEFISLSEIKPPIYLL